MDAVFDIEDGGIEVTKTAMPAGVPEPDIREAIALIHEWEASDHSASQLIAALYPVLTRSVSHQE